MRGYELTLVEFVRLLGLTSRRHMKPIVESLPLTVHTRRGTVVFKDGASRMIPIEEVHRLIQADALAQRLVYNLWMHVAHFGELP